MVKFIEKGKKLSSQKKLNQVYIFHTFLEKFKALKNKEISYNLKNNFKQKPQFPSESGANQTRTTRTRWTSSRRTRT